MSKAVEFEVEKCIAELFNEGEIELVDVEYVKEHDWYLRVFIDKPEGIDIEDCQIFSEKIEEILDQEDIIPDSYILEVSSPGLDRVLKREKDFIREKGKIVDVSLYEPINGEKKITGVLEGRTEKELLLKEKESLPLIKVAQVRLHIDF